MKDVKAKIYIGDTPSQCRVTVDGKTLAGVTGVFVSADTKEKGATKVCLEMLGPGVEFVGKDEVLRSDIDIELDKLMDSIRELKEAVAAKKMGNIEIYVTQMFEGALSHEQVQQAGRSVEEAVMKALSKRSIL